MERVGVGACRRIGVGDATLKKLGGASPPVPEKNRYADKRRRANSSPLRRYAHTPIRSFIGGEDCHFLVQPCFTSDSPDAKKSSA